MPPSPFRYHMTRSSMGFVFSSYTATAAIPQAGLESLIAHAAEEVGETLGLHPDLALEILYEDVEWKEDDAGGISLIVEPAQPSMRFGDLMRMLLVLAGWAERFAAVECEFEIWAWPGVRSQRYLGKGQLVLAA